METKKTHWLQNPNKNYLGHWDLPNGNDLTLTIKSAKWEDVKNPITNKSESKRVVRFKEKGTKPMICNQTNSVSITKATGVKFMEDSNDKKITLFVATIIDNKTKENIDCIRIRETTPKLPELKSSDIENWEKVKSAMLNGFTIKQIRTKWIVSEENESKLNHETTI